MECKFHSYYIIYIIVHSKDVKNIKINVLGPVSQEKSRESERAKLSDELRESAGSFRTLKVLDFVAQKMFLIMSTPLNVRSLNSSNGAECDE